MDKDLGISISNMQNAVERDSIVLARMPEFKQDDKKWVAASFDRMKENGGRKLYLCSGVWYLQCIPYHLNEEILATEDNPKDLTHLSWGMDCLVADDLSEEWQEALLVGFDKTSAYPWIALQKTAIEQNLELQRPVPFSEWRYLKIKQ